MFRFFFAVIFAKFNDFVNSDDCIGEITPKSNKRPSVFNHKKI